MLRLCAATQVVWDHASTHLALYTPAFATAVFHAVPGVPVFFVISGFLISMSYERSLATGTIGTYYLNRFLRIYPALWTALLIGVVSVLIFGSVSFYNATAASLLRWLLAQVTFIQFDNPDFLRHYGVGVLNGSLWTIPVELEFYVSLPLLYAACRLRPGSGGNGVLISLCALFLLLNAGFFGVSGGQEHATWYKLVKVSLAPYLYVFLIGVLIQRNLNLLRPFLAGKAVWWVAAYTMACVGASRSGWVVSGNNFPFPLMVVLAFTIVSCAFSAPGLAQSVLKGRDLSYGTYVYHMLVVNVLVQLGLRGTGLLAGAAAFGFTYILAFASWSWVEAPALALRGRLSKVPRPLVDAV